MKPRQLNELFRELLGIYNQREVEERIRETLNRAILGNEELPVGGCGIGEFNGYNFFLEYNEDTRMLTLCAEIDNEDDTVTHIPLENANGNKVLEVYVEDRAIENGFRTLSRQLAREIGQIIKANK